jgi:4-hydroxybenzoate polyprenyltransferase
MKSVLKELRIHQWAKNLLVFLPLITSHQINWHILGIASLGFVCFSLAASSVYILNDLFDLEDDRRHPLKRNRPIASGDLGIIPAIVLMGSLIVALGALSIYIPKGALVILGIYYGITILYSWVLKEMPVIDIYALSALYSIRVLFGHAITGIPPTSWLIIFCLFFFLSLASLKRVSELTQVKEHNQTLSKRRGYCVQDLSVLIPTGIGCALSSILIFGLYINSDQVKLLYAHPDRLWGCACLLLFWKLRLWFLGGRGLIDQDPVIFVLRDKVTIAIGLGVLLSAFLGSSHGF